MMENKDSVKSQELPSKRWKWAQQLVPFWMFPVLCGIRRGDFTQAQLVAASTSLRPPTPELVEGFPAKFQAFVVSHTKANIKGGLRIPSYSRFLLFLFSFNIAESLSCALLAVLFILSRLANQTMYTELMGLLLDQPPELFSTRPSMGLVATFFILAALLSSWFQNQLDL